MKIKNNIIHIFSKISNILKYKRLKNIIQGIITCISIYIQMFRQDYIKRRSDEVVRYI